MKYSKPSVTDHGTLADITRATAIFGLTEDTTMKVLPNHHTPTVPEPSGPSGP